MHFEYGRAYGRVWVTLTVSEREEIERMKRYIANHPFDPLHEYYYTVLGQKWYAHQGGGFILVFRVEGMAVKIAQIVRWSGPDYTDPETGRDDS